MPCPHVLNKICAVHRINCGAHAHTQARARACACMKSSTRSMSSQSRSAPHLISHAQSGDARGQRPPSRTPWAFRTLRVRARKSSWYSRAGQTGSARMSRCRQTCWCTLDLTSPTLQAIPRSLLVRVRPTWIGWHWQLQVEAGCRPAQPPPRRLALGGRDLQHRRQCSAGSAAAPSRRHKATGSGWHSHGPWPGLGLRVGGAIAPARATSI